MNFKHLAVFAAIFWSVNTSKAQNWPALKHYDENHVSKVALPIGGIGTGTVSINGRGNLVDWEIMNRPGKGFSTVPPGNDAPFFAIHIDTGEKTFTKGLMGPLLDYEYEHMEGRPVDHHGVPRFEKATFDAAYPFGVVNLSDYDWKGDKIFEGAVKMIYEDMEQEGLQIIRNIRNRYNGAKRSPFNEAECGHHYARAMASWASVLALSD